VVASGLLNRKRRVDISPAPEKKRENILPALEKKRDMNCVPVRRGVSRGKRKSFGKRGIYRGRDSNGPSH